MLLESCRCLGGECPMNNGTKWKFTFTPIVLLCLQTKNGWCLAKCQAASCFFARCLLLFRLSQTRVSVFFPFDFCTLSFVRAVRFHVYVHLRRWTLCEGSTCKWTNKRVVESCFDKVGLACNCLSFAVSLNRTVLQPLYVMGCRDDKVSQSLLRKKRLPCARSRHARPLGREILFCGHRCKHRTTTDGGRKQRVQLWKVIDDS